MIESVSAQTGLWWLSGITSWSVHLVNPIRCSTPPKASLHVCLNTETQRIRYSNSSQIFCSFSSQHACSPNHVSFPLEHDEDLLSDVTLELG